jgi:hypothetical protein
MPDEQIVPAGHAMPHAPQFALSLFRSRQVPLQSVKPVPHVT